MAKKKSVDEMAALVEEAMFDCINRSEGDGYLVVSPAAMAILVAGQSEWEPDINPTLPGISVAFHIS